MRDVTRLERAIILLALYVWRWQEAVRDFAATVEENRRGLRRGAADLDWQRTLRVLAAPIRERRLIEESGDNLVDVVTVAEWREKGQTIQMAIPAPAPAVAPPPPRPLAGLEAWVIEAGATGVSDIAPLTLGFDGAYNGPLVAITETGTVVETIPTPSEHIRNHRHQVQPKRPRKVAAAAKKALLEPVGAPEVRAAEARVLRQLDVVVAEAMRALGLDAEEAKSILGLWSYAS